MSVKHVSASKTPGLQGANPRRPLNIAAARPTQKSAVVVGESKAPAEGAGAVMQPLQADHRVMAEGVLPDTPSETVTSHAGTQSDATDPAAELLNAVGPAPASARVGPAVDYYTIITKTIEGLALNNVETRSEIYDRARKIIEERLKDAGPSISSHMVAIEQTAFDRAVKKIESEQLERQLAGAISGAKEMHGKAAAIATDTADAAAAPAITAEAAALLEAAPAAETGQQDQAPAIVVVRRARPAPPIRQTHGGTLRLFALIGLVVVGFGGYWLITGKPDLAGMHNLTHIVTKPPQQQPVENPDGNTTPAVAAPSDRQAANAPAKSEPPVPASPPVAPAPADDDIDVTSPEAYNVQLATFLSLCRPAQTAYGEDACGNLQPRPFGGPGVTPRNAVEWVAMYASLSEIPMRRVKKPVFTIPAALPQANAAPTGNLPDGVAPVRTGHAGAKERYERGIDLAKNDNLDGAIDDFSEAIRLDPKFADAYVQRGQAMFKNGNAERAIADFTQALQIDPRNIPAYKARGMAMLYKGNDDGAIADLTKAIQYAEIDTGAIPAIEVFFARRSRAALYDRKQLYDRELVDLTAMIDGYWRDPGLAAALRNTYRDQGVAALMASIYRLRAGVHQKRANLDAAIGDISLALQLDSQRTLQYLIERGRLLEAAGRREQAIADYQQALELSPNNTDVRNSLTRLKGRT